MAAVVGVVLRVVRYVRRPVLALVGVMPACCRLTHLSRCCPCCVAGVALDTVRLIVRIVYYVRSS